MVVQLDAGGLRWLQNYAWKNHWKVKHVYDDIADLIQDGHMCWGIVANKYPHIPDLTKDGRLMSLFKLTFVNHIRWIATMDKDKEYNKVKINLDNLVCPNISVAKYDTVIDILYRKQGLTGDLTSDFRVSQTIIEASEPIRSVLRFLVSDFGVRAMQRPFRRRLDGTRETVNARISRYIGRGAELDLLAMTKQYLLEAAI